MSTETFTLDELCQLVNLDKRTIRYYIQIGLVPRPIGETKAARYSNAHLERLLLVKKWRDSGLSLERIAELFDDDKTPPITARRLRRGEVEVRSHITVCAGVEIQISPAQSELTTEQIRELIRQISAFAETFTKEK
ncbi:MAG: helix-turn-helix domain-containing protein [Campylobacteraceae bacterium]|jgi:DNA-binding transcriptional MerR regulator|nr:helix-turn-helix domain-containing protein [Campylobacteraceae bacterium]